MERANGGAQVFPRLGELPVGTATLGGVDLGERLPSRRGQLTAIAVLIVYAVINTVVQSIIQPRVVGEAVSLNQTVTLFSVLFWAVIIGPVEA